MAGLRSKLTARGQTSVPAQVRRKLGLGPGSVLEWEEDGESIVVRRVGRYSSEEIHQQLFARGPKRRTTAELKEGIRRRTRKSGHLPLGTFDRDLAKIDGAHRL